MTVSPMTIHLCVQMANENNRHFRIYNFVDSHTLEDLRKTGEVLGFEVAFTHLDSDSV